MKNPKTSQDENEVTATLEQGSKPAKTKLAWKRPELVKIELRETRRAASSNGDTNYSGSAP